MGIQAGVPMRTGFLGLININSYNKKLEGILFFSFQGARV